MKRIALHGVPRSGTTWIGALFDSSPVVRYVNQPLFSYAFKGGLDGCSDRTDIKGFFDRIANSADTFINQTEQKLSRAIPIFSKLEPEAICYKEARYHHLIPHLLQTDPELFMFLIVRNPLSVLASWRKAPKEFDPERMDLFEEWRKAEKKNMGRPEEWYGFEKWKAFALMAMQMSDLYPSRCRIVNYHALLCNTRQELASHFQFCGIPFGPQTEAFIHESRSKDLAADAYSVFRVKQQDDGWKKELPVEIASAIIAELENTPLGQYLE